jgi:glycosyltransferase involved in cell wall biosynthesis
VSDGIRDELIIRGIQDSRIRVIPNAVAPHCGTEEMLTYRLEKRRSLNIALQEYVVGYTGRLSEEKGLIYLVGAVANLRDAAVPVKLLIVGDGPERLALEQLVRDRGLENLVIFAGFQTDVEKWLPVLDVFILPSLTEGTPMALLEAMAASVPVIATAVGGVPKVITDGVDGLLVPSGNVGAISEKILCLKDDSELQRRLGRAGFDTVTCKYAINSWCQAIEGLYCRV